MSDEREYRDRLEYDNDRKYGYTDYYQEPSYRKVRPELSIEDLQYENMRLRAELRELSIRLEDAAVEIDALRNLSNPELESSMRAELNRLSAKVAMYEAGYAEPSYGQISELERLKNEICLEISRSNNSFEDIKAMEMLRDILGKVELTKASVLSELRAQNVSEMDILHMSFNSLRAELVKLVEEAKESEELRSLFERLSSMESALTESTNVHSARIEDLRDDLDRLKGVLTGLGSEVLKIVGGDTIATLYTDVKKRMDEVAEHLANVSGGVDKLMNLENLSVNLDGVVNKMAAINAEMQDVPEGFGKIRARMDVFDENLSEFRGALVLGIDNEKNLIDEQLTKLRETIAELEERLNESQQDMYAQVVEHVEDLRGDIMKFGETGNDAVARFDRVFEAVTDVKNTIVNLKGDLAEWESNEVSEIANHVAMLREEFDNFLHGDEHIASIDQLLEKTDEILKVLNEKDLGGTNGNVAGLIEALQTGALGGIIAEISAVKEKLDAAKADRESLVESLAAAKVDREFLLESLASAKADRESLVESLAAAKVDRESLLESLASAKADRESLVESLAAAKVDRESLLESLASAKADRESLVESLAAAKVDRESLLESLASAKADREVLVENLNAAKEDRLVLVQSLAAAKADRESLMESLAAAKADRESLINELDDIKRMIGMQTAMSAKNESMETLGGEFESLRNFLTTGKLAEEIYTTRRLVESMGAPDLTEWKKALSESKDETTVAIASELSDVKRTLATILERMDVPVVSVPVETVSAEEHAEALKELASLKASVAATTVRPVEDEFGEHAGEFLTTSLSELRSELDEIAILVGEPVSKPKRNASKPSAKPKTGAKPKTASAKVTPSEEAPSVALNEDEIQKKLDKIFSESEEFKDILKDPEDRNF